MNANNVQNIGRISEPSGSPGFSERFLKSIGYTSLGRVGRNRFMTQRVTEYN